MQAGLAKKQWPLEGRCAALGQLVPGLATRSTSIVPARALPERVRRSPGVDLPERCGYFLLADVAGRQGDWAKLDRILGESARAGRRRGPPRPVGHGFLACGPGSLRGGGPIARPGRADRARVGLPSVLGGDTNWGLMDTAKCASSARPGRTEEADRLAAGAARDGCDRVAQGRHDRAPGTSGTPAPCAYASLAANEGLKDEAVAALQLAMRCGDLPFGFWPQLPWFKAWKATRPTTSCCGSASAGSRRFVPNCSQLEARPPDASRSNGRVGGRGAGYSWRREQGDSARRPTQRPRHAAGCCTACANAACCAWRRATR